MRIADIKKIEPKREHGDIANLKQSIESIGLINPLTVDQDGNLLAGRRRYQAIMELGWQEVDVTVLPVDGDEAKAFLISIHENLCRKPMTDPEMATTFKDYDEIKRRQYGNAERYSHPKATSDSEVAWTLQKSCDDWGIALATGHTAIKIATDIEEYPELAKEKSGQAVMKKYKKKKEQEELLKVQAEPQGENYQLHCGDFRDLSLTPNSIDCVITDPPYGKESLPLYDALVALASRLLKPGGSLLVISGLMFLPTLLDKLSKGLTYQWTLAFKMGTGTARVYPRKVCQVWKPILWFVKGNYSGEWITDFISSQKVEKTLNDYQQPEAVLAKLVSNFSQLNDVILDPMMGTGTTGLSAISLGRRFIGCEIDKEVFQIAKGRLNGRTQNIS